MNYHTVSAADLADIRRVLAAAQGAVRALDEEIADTARHLARVQEEQLRRVEEAHRAMEAFLAASAEESATGAEAAP